LSAAVSLAVHVIWVAIAQAGMDLAAEGAGTRSYVLGGLLVSRLLAGQDCM
jgi:hypothetical protein